MKDNYNNSSSSSFILFYSFKEDWKVLDHLKFLTSFLSGGLAGLIAKTIVAPLDRIKIIFQVTNEKFSFRNMPNIIRHVIVEEGFFSLWKGNSAMILRIAPYAAIQFMTYEQMKAWFVRNSESKNLLTEKYSKMITELMICGGVAGAVSSFATYPLDLARSRLAVELNSPKSSNQPKIRLSLRVLSLIYEWASVGGIRGLYRGLTPTLLGIIPYGAISFSTNEVTKRMMQEFTGKDVKMWQKLLCGAIAGAAAQTIVYPFEMVRRRMQTTGHVDRNAYLSQLSKSNPCPNQQINLPTPKESELTMSGTIRQLYRTEGLKGFYKGVTLNWIKGPITVGISFTAYDFMKKFSEDFLNDLR